MMDPRTHHKRVQAEHMNKQHRNAVLQRLGIAHLRHVLHPNSDDEGEGLGGGGGEGDKVHDEAYEQRRAAGIGSTSLKRAKPRAPTVLSAHLTETHAQVRQFYELLSAWLAPISMGLSVGGAGGNGNNRGGARSVSAADSRDSTAAHGGGEDDIAFAPECAREVGGGGSTADDPMDAVGGGERRSSYTANSVGNTVPSSDANKTRRSSRKSYAASHAASDHSAGTPPAPPFPFAIEWLRTVLGGDVVEALGSSEKEAQHVLRDQISRSARTASQERVMCDTSDYGALRESVLSYLGMIFFAVNDAVMGCSPTVGPTTTTSSRGQRSTTFLTNAHAIDDDGDAVFGGKHSSPHRTASNLSPRNTRGGGGSSRPGSSRYGSTEEAAMALQARLASSASAHQHHANGAVALPQPPIIDMNIARAICRPSSASIVAGSSTAAGLVGGVGGGGRPSASALTYSPRESGLRTAMATVQRSKGIRDNIIPILSLAAQLNEGAGGDEEDGDGGVASGHAADGRDGAPSFAADPDVGDGTPTAASGPHQQPFSSGPSYYAAGGGTNLANGNGNSGTADKHGPFEALKERHRRVYGSARSVRGGSVGGGGVEMAALRQGTHPPPATSGRPTNSSRPSTAGSPLMGDAQRSLISHRPKPPTGAVEVASARVKVTDNAPEARSPPLPPNAITSHAVASANGIVIVPQDTIKGRGAYSTPSIVHGDPSLVLASPAAGGVGGSGAPVATLVGGEWGVGTSTWSPRSDAKWVDKKSRPPSMRSGRR